MEIPLEKFFQIFSHGCLTAFDGMADGALVNALLPGNLAVALAEDQMCLYPTYFSASFRMAAKVSSAR